MGVILVPEGGVSGMFVSVTGTGGTFPQAAIKKPTRNRTENTRYSCMVFLIASDKDFTTSEALLCTRQQSCGQAQAVLWIIILAVTTPNTNANRQIARAAGAVML